MGEEEKIKLPFYSSAGTSNISRGIALLISMYFPPESLGGSTGAWNRAMVLRKIGYSVFVLCGFPSFPTGKVTDSKYKGKLFYVENNYPFTVIRIRLLPISHQGFIRRLIIFLNFIFLSILYLPRVLKVTGNIDLVYARAPIVFSSIIGLAYSRAAKSFFIYEAPDLWPEELIAFKIRFLQLIIPIGKIAAKLSYRTPHVIVTIGELAAEYIRKEYKPKAQVFGIPVGVDPAKFPKLSKQNARYNLIEKGLLPAQLVDQFIVLYSGRISEAQHVESLIYAAERLRDKKISILIVGEGPQKHRLVQLKSEHNLENIYLMPPQPWHVMPSLISAADICTVLLSSEPIFEMAMPTKFYEYLASCKPLIGVCNGELANTIITNNIGYVAKVGDIEGLASGILSLNSSPNSMYIMEVNCNRTLQKFSLDAIASIFDRIINDKERRQ
jgi:glycosyltransferase involved in cell wall biosynthesis